MAAFEAEAFGGAADVAVELVQFFEDVVAFVGFACLLERGELFIAPVGFAGIAAGGVSVDQHREMLALDAQCLGVEDEDAFDEIAELAKSGKLDDAWTTPPDAVITSKDRALALPF